MSGLLAGLPGQLKTLLDRLTSTRAAKLDNADAQVSLIAPASTAVSDTDYTPTRAGYLDRINATVTSRAQSSGTPNNTDYSGTRAGYLDLLNSRLDQKVSATNVMLYPGSAGAAGSDSTTSGSWSTAYSYTGSGALCYLKAYGDGLDGSGETTIGIKVIIDGNNAWGDSVGVESESVYADRNAIFCFQWSGTLPFDSSITIQIRELASGATARCVWGVMKT